jgi:predicted Rdx family selenoprotein
VSLAREVLDLWAPLFRQVELITGVHGVFRVELDDQTVYDREDTHRFPRPGEVPRLLRPTLGEPPDWK